MTVVETVSADQLIAAARELAPRIAVRGDEIEQARRLPDDLVRELREARFFRMFLPGAYGGDEIDPLTAIVVTEELVRADGSVG